MRQRSWISALISAAGAVALAGCSMVGIRSGTEETPYTVEDRIGDSVEIRRYAERVSAQVTVEAADDRAGRNAAFKLLFDYISGANAGEQSVAMTAPVQVDRPAQKIAMTAPVETGRSEGGRYQMRFFLPASYTPATAPKPTDPRVEIVPVVAEMVAVLRYTGSTDEDSAKRRQDELLTILQASAWQPAGNPTSYFYDPPWTLPFLRRNEAVVSVARSAGP